MCIFQYQYGLIPREFSVTASQFFSDKLILGKRLDSKRALKKALKALQQKDFPAAASHAAAALVGNPEEERTLIVAGLAGLLGQDADLARRAFATLRARYPDNALYPEGQAAAERQRLLTPELQSKLHDRMMTLVNR